MTRRVSVISRHKRQHVFLAIVLDATSLHSVLYALYAALVASPRLPASRTVLLCALSCAALCAGANARRFGRGRDTASTVGCHGPGVGRRTGTRALRCTAQRARGARPLGARAGH